MNAKVFSIVLVLFGFYSNVEPGKLEDAMPYVRKVYAIGWKEHPFPSSLSDMSKTCEKFISKISDPELMTYFKDDIFPTNAEFRKDMLETIKLALPSKICNRASNKDDKLIGQLKEINSKVDKLAIYRDYFAKIFADALKPDTKYRPPQVLCLLNNYVKESADQVSPDAKDVVKDHLSGFKTIFRRYKPDEKCPWPTEKPKPEDIQKIELNYVKTLASLLNKYPPK